MDISCNKQGLAELFSPDITKSSESTEVSEYKKLTTQVGDTSFDNRLVKKKLEDWLITPECSASTKKASAVYSMETRKDGWSSLNNLPLNFIWFGSVIPDKYLVNILNWSASYPKRPTIIWINSELLSKEELDQMDKLNDQGYLKSLLAKFGSNPCCCSLRVCDINKSEILMSGGVSEINRYLYDNVSDLEKHEKTEVFTIGSDLFRLLLINHGSTIIKQYPGINLALDFEEGMIYFDTDINFEACKGLKEMYFKGEIFSPYGGNDIFAASHGNSDFFRCYLHQFISNMIEIMNKCDIRSALTIETEIGNGLHCFGGMHFLREEAKKHYDWRRKVYMPFVNTAPFHDSCWLDGRALDMKRTILNA